MAWDTSIAALNQHDKQNGYTPGYAEPRNEPLVLSQPKGSDPPHSNPSTDPHPLILLYTFFLIKRYPKIKPDKSPWSCNKKVDIKISHAAYFNCLLDLT